MQRFENLEVWKRSARLSCEVYKHFADSRDFGFKDQITRSSLSIASNIAEGHERRTTKEFANFLSYAKGSSGELRTQIYIGIDINYIPSSLGKAWITEAEEISKMISGLVKSISED
ncbi:four helix bundle protein [Alginatibacterium sediminis]|uniref:Four helix bundle protein n=1 Tax=Alginatibacterium sediminis TaxID=2164068 RepID=A0A420E5S2_9ALTE|nr:four helix bundle protein [Alginatibacterium sediminis]RKF13144.1 four helix bundle protein [Alginatibacterium sediminis]